MANGRPHPDVVELLQGTPLKINMLQPPKKFKFDVLDIFVFSIWGDLLGSILYSFSGMLLNSTFWAPQKIWENQTVRSFGRSREQLATLGAELPFTVKRPKSYILGEFSPGNEGVCSSFVRVGMKRKLGEKNILQSLKLWINESNLQNSWKILEMRKCHPFLTKMVPWSAGSMLCVCSLRKDIYYIHMYILEDSIILIGS